MVLLSPWCVWLGPAWHPLHQAVLIKGLFIPFWVPDDLLLTLIISCSTLQFISQPFPTWHIFRKILLLTLPSNPGKASWRGCSEALNLQGSIRTQLISCSAVSLCERINLCLADCLGRGWPLTGTDNMVQSSSFIQRKERQGDRSLCSTLLSIWNLSRFRSLVVKAVFLFCTAC